MKRLSKYLLISYILIFFLTLFMMCDAGQYFPFYLLILIFALIIMIIEENIKNRFLGALLVLFALTMIISDLQNKLVINNRIWEAVVKSVQLKNQKDLK